MIKDEIVEAVVNTLLAKIDDKHQEVGRILVHDEFEEFSNQIIMWAIRENIRDLKETTVTNLEEFEDIEIKLTFAHPSFFEEVISGYKDVPFWQVATVKRLLTKCDVVFDPKGIITKWVEKIEFIEWDSKLISLKREVTKSLLKRVKNRLNQDMLADAYVWLIKAAEEALCVPLMKQNTFEIGTATMMLDFIRESESYYYDLFSDLLNMRNLEHEDVEKARKELEILGDHLFQKFTRTRREMWILTAFVSINESERRLNQSKMDVTKPDRIRLFETSIGELWQAYFLIAQTPRTEAKLDPYVVGSFWNTFGSERVTEEWIMEKVEEIESIIG